LGDCYWRPYCIDHFTGERGGHRPYKVDLANRASVVFKAALDPVEQRLGFEALKESSQSNVRFCLAEFRGCPGRKANVQISE